jgi:hypothetical protein
MKNNYDFMESEAMKEAKSTGNNQRRKNRIGNSII